ncbi:MAG: hypothetical protein V3V08_01095 [Nannocystaceae bacterium]
MLPDHGVSGLELSWQLGETNDVDGEPALIRSCSGGLVSDVRFEIEDLHDSDRSRSFAFGCGAGFRTADALLLTLGEIYLELQPGTYRIQSEAVDDPAKRGAAGEAEIVASADDEFEIVSGGPTLAHYVYAPAVVDLRLELTGLERCDTTQLRLEYADPDADLVQYSTTTDVTAYRTALTSDLGLTLDGRTHACESLAGTHTFPELDRGIYSLTLTLDGARECSAQVVHDGRHGLHTLDLAELGC